MAPPSASSRLPNADLDSRVSLSRPLSFQLGTGADLYTNALIPAILSARHEVILVTCFWAPSRTLSALRTCLQDLAARREAFISQGRSLPPLKVSICFSSRSLLQKLLHTSSPDGYTYPPSSWPIKLGLPDRTVLESGNIDLSVKSLFFLPFSVMHPKYLVIDRQRALIPSCNASWEAWLEACIEITGPALEDLLRFYSSTWDKGFDPEAPLPSLPEGTVLPEPSPEGEPAAPSGARFVYAFPDAEAINVATSILPSPHCRNPRFRPFPWQAAPPAPSTPLNSTLLRLLEESQESIYVQTPNITSAPVIDALLGAIRRGIDVTVVTSRNMMLLEQLVTSGTMTSWCLRSFIRRYKSVCSKFPESNANEGLVDPEIQVPRPGKLRISYFHPRQRGLREGRGGRADVSATAGFVPEKPVHSHLKLTIVDGRFTVLGSGNMDRASWYTSQELGILFDDARFAGTIKNAVSQVLVDRLETVFDAEYS